MKPSDLVDRIKDLPTLPTVAAQINAEIQKESLTAKSLAAIIVQDSSLTAKILKLANSAFYGLVRQVDTIDRAITVLGLSTVRNLAITVSIFKFFQKDSGAHINMEDLWYHSLGCAVAARTLVAKANRNLTDKAFICGILHDIGKNIIAINLPDEMAQVLMAIKETNKRQSDVEKEILGFSHARIGSVLAESWNFPSEYSNAIKLHHNPFLSKSKDESELRLIIAVHIANKITKIKKFGQSTDPNTDHIETKAWRMLNIEKEHVPVLLKTVLEDYQKAVAAWKS